jgi:protein-disulfide isomerase
MNESRRRTTILLGGLLAAALIVVLVVVLAGGGSDKKTSTTQAGEPAPGGPETQELLGGIAQDGFTLGKADAPLTMIEFNDMQCPVCKEYDATVFPVLIDEYVRTGKMRMEMRLQSFIGPDSVKGGKAVAAAAAQNQAWPYEHLFYVNQGTENSGYVTDDFLRSLGRAVPGLEVDQLMKDKDTPAAQAVLDKGKADFEAAGFDGTPSFLVGPTGGTLRPLRYTQLDPAQFTKQIDAALARQ